MLNDDEYKKLWIDFEALNKMIDIKDVIRRYTLVNVDVKGNICCPSPRHQDDKPSAKIYPNNRCRCFACGQSWSPLSLYMEIMGIEKRNVKEASLNLLQDFNIPLSSVSNINMIETKDVIKEDSFPFSNDEIKLIGLDNPYKNKVINRYKYSLQDKELHSETTSVIGLNDYYKTDRNGCLELILRKCIEKQSSLLELRISTENNISEYESNPQKLNKGKMAVKEFQITHTLNKFSFDDYFYYSSYQEELKILDDIFFQEKKVAKIINIVLEETEKDKTGKKQTGKKAFIDLCL